MRKELDATAVLVMLALCLVWGLQQTAIKAIAEQVDVTLAPKRRYNAGLKLIDS